MSIKARSLLVLVAVLAGSPLAMGQATSQPAGSDVLKRVPAGCMAFVVINNVKDFTGKIDGFVNAISPDKKLLERPILEELKVDLKLTEGLDAAGGFAAVVMDFKKYNYDAVGAIDALSGNAPPKAGGEGFPAALIIPTADLTKLLAAYTPTKKDDYYTLTLPDKIQRFAKQAGNYVVMGQNLKVVKDIVANEKSVTDQLSAADKETIAKNAIAAWVDVKTAQPLAEDLLKKLSSEQGVARPVIMMEPQMAAIREGLKQLDHLTFGGRITDVGIVTDFRVSFRPDSAMGKLLAEYKPVKTESLLDKLPDMPYILAAGGQSVPKKSADEIRKELTTAFEAPPYKDLPAETKKKLLDVMVNMAEQVNGCQVYIGNNTTGEGVVGLAIVLDVASAAKVQENLKALSDVGADLIKNLPMGLNELTVNYGKGALTVDGKSVDTITISHPEMASMPEDAQKAMKNVLGQTEIQFYVAPVNDKTVVVTFGGSTKFLGEAMKVSAGGGKLPDQPDVAKILALLPKDRQSVILFNAGNIATLVKNISNAVGEPLPVPIKMGATLPVAMAGYIDRKDQCATIIVPTETVREVVRLFMSFMGSAMEGAMPMDAAPPVLPQ